MEKRIFLAFFIIFIFLVFWSRLVPKPTTPLGPQAETKKAQPSSSNTDLVQSAELSEEPISEVPDGKEENLGEVKIGNFIITYSSKGGYIKSIALGSADVPLPFKNIGFIPRDKEKKYSVSVTNSATKQTLEFLALNGEKKVFAFKGYILQISLPPPTAGQVSVFSNYLEPNALEQRYQELFYSSENMVQRSAPKKIKEAELKEVNFAGARNRYYCASLLKGSYQLKWVKNKDSASLYLISPAAEISLYIGPQIEAELKKYNLQEVVSYGFFHLIGVAIIKLLHFFYFLTKNWGLSLISLTVAIYLFLFPFTAKSTKAMKKMQEIQPKIEELRKKYKDDPQKFSKEQLELFREYKINPLGGCLPLFLQLPIFFALYQVLFRAVELKGARFLWIKDLSLADHAFKLPLPPPVDYLNLLPIGIMITGLIQQKIMSSGSSLSPEQKSMGLFFSVFLGFIFYPFPAALTLYWFIQNLLTLVYQVRISRSAHKEIAIPV
jgi:YidC/Oxa1 family membrane protein insertase